MKDRTILAIKGLAISGVVFHHLGNRRLEPDAATYMIVLVSLFHWCVLAFFCVSGYLQALSDSKKTKSILEFARNRVNRLLLPYAVLILFYSCVWQTIQAFHIANIGIKVPPDFIGKLRDGLWPVEGVVAQQLYFFPLLFGISILLFIIHHRLGLYGLWAVSWITAVVGIAIFPNVFTGFNLGVFDWGICFYASGYLLFYFRKERTSIRVLCLVFTLLLLIFNGVEGLIRCVPLWLISEGSTLRLDRSAFLARLGDASGTIYVYHTPFLIQPLVIAATYLPGGTTQFVGIVCAAAVAIAICYAIFELLKNTHAKILLM